MNTISLRRLFVLAILLFIYAGFSLADTRYTSIYAPQDSGNYVLEPFCNSSGTESTNFLSNDALKVDCTMKEARDNDKFAVTFVSYK